MFEYKAFVTKVYDGDTITVNIDLGFYTWKMKQKIRLASINAPEIRGEQRPQGLVSRDYLASLILEKEVVIVTDQDKTGKYGRWIGTIYQINEDGTLDTVSVNEKLVQQNLAEHYT